MHYHVVPVVRCFAPSKTFTRLADALHYGRRAALGHKVEYVLWHRERGVLRLVRRFPPGPVRRTFPCND